MLINISRKNFHKLQVEDFSSYHEESTRPQKIFSDNGYWSSEKSTAQRSEYLTFALEDEQFINYIEMEPSSNGKKSFPESFRTEYSLDGKKWFLLSRESNYIMDEPHYYINTPLIKAKYIRLFISSHNNSNNSCYSEISTFKAGIIGVKSVNCSNSSSKIDPSEALFGDNNKCWVSDSNNSKTREHIEIELDNNFNISQVLMKSPEDPEGFPSNFTIEASSDKKMWTLLAEEKSFKCNPGQTYGWNCEGCNAKYIRFEMDRVETAEKRFFLKLGGIEILASPLNVSHTHLNQDDISYASIFQAGIMKFSKDGETIKGTAVQADDRRLREGTTLFKGIVQFAEHGENQSGYAVQADDERLSPATELKPGIVRLAYNGEKKEGVAVQSNDSRLDRASEKSFGVVKLCPEGAYSELGVVKGSDPRLREATEKSHGIVRLAENGEDSPNSAVQANDQRLKKATTESTGIVELAENGEAEEGKVVQSHDKRLKDATTTSTGIVELAEDGEDKEGVVVQGNDKRLRNATTSAKGIVELAEDGEDKIGVVVQGNDKRLKDAAENRKGIMRFASNGESNASAAVQGNDRRLKDATTTSTGIVELAEDGEDKEGVVVQGNDKRLRNATTSAKGIVELAEDGEDKEGVVVQGNDKRLKNATTAAKGIVELAEDGEDKEGVAVQGNDKRLRNATTNYKGIVQMAEDGQDRAGVVVQGNDKRLKDATENSKGIMRFASNGEESEFAAVQGNDKRLKDATTILKGIVELAEDGEESAGVAVQGNDKRLKKAREDQPGIVRLAKDGESKRSLAVQSDDNRLSDPRKPLPHDHDYAPLNHDFDSHEGTLAIEDEKNETFKGIAPLTKDSSIIFGKNKSTKNGAVAIAGIIDSSGENNQANSYGLLGHGPSVGVRGQSSGSEKEKSKGCGVLGISRFGAGGVFASEHDFSLVVDGHCQIDKYDDSAKLIGNGDGLKVKGSSLFDGKITLKSSGDKSEKYTANMVELFETDNTDFISPGDLLVVSDKGESILTKTRKSYNRSVIGVVAGNPVIEINNSGKEDKLYPIALSGKALCKVDARNTPIKPGDLIVTSENPGCGMKGDINSFDRVGTVIGKALTGLSDGIDVIPIFLMPM